MAMRSLACEASIVDHLCFHRKRTRDMRSGEVRVVRVRTPLESGIESFPFMRWIQIATVTFAREWGNPSVEIPRINPDEFGLPGHWGEHQHLRQGYFDPLGATQRDLPHGRVPASLHDSLRARVEDLQHIGRSKVGELPMRGASIRLGAFENPIYGILQLAEGSLSSCKWGNYRAQLDWRCASKSDLGSHPFGLWATEHRFENGGSKHIFGAWGWGWKWPDEAN